MFTDIVKVPRFSDAQATVAVRQCRSAMTDSQRWALDTTYRTPWEFSKHHGRISEIQLRAKDLVRYLADHEGRGDGLSKVDIASVYRELAAKHSFRTAGVRS